MLWFIRSGSSEKPAGRSFGEVSPAACPSSPGALLVWDGWMRSESYWLFPSFSGFQPISSPSACAMRRIMRCKNTNLPFHLWTRCNPQNNRLFKHHRRSLDQFSSHSDRDPAEFLIHPGRFIRRINDLGFPDDGQAIQQIEFWFVQICIGLYAGSDDPAGSIKSKERKNDTFKRIGKISTFYWDPVHVPHGRVLPCWEELEPPVLPLRRPAGRAWHTSHPFNGCIFSMSS